MGPGPERKFRKRVSLRKKVWRCREMRLRPSSSMPNCYGRYCCRHASDQYRVLICPSSILILDAVSTPAASAKN